MLLSDWEIQKEIRGGFLRFTPPIVEDGPDRQIGSNGIDLRLGVQFYKYREPVPILGLEEVKRVDLARIEQQKTFRSVFGACTEQIIVAEDGFYLLEPGQLVLGETLEYVELPGWLAGRVEGRSGWARLGLGVHLTAPTIQSGFEGRIALELFNHGSLVLELRPRQLRICQLLLERLSYQPTKAYSGQYQAQVHLR